MHLAHYPNDILLLPWAISAPLSAYMFLSDDTKVTKMGDLLI